MAIVKMKKLRLLAIRAQEQELLRDLLLLGCVEVSELPEETEPELQGLVCRESSDASSLRDMYARLTGSVKTLGKYAPFKKGLLTPLPETSTAELLSEERLSDCLAKAAEIAALDERVRRLIAEEGRLRAHIETLRPWEPLDVPLDMDGTRSCASFCGAFPASTDMSAMHAVLEEAAPETQTYIVSSDRDQICVFTVCLREEREAALTALRSFGFSIPTLQNVSGTARECIAVAEKNLESLAVEKAELVSRIADFAPDRAQLELCADTVSTRIARAEASEKLLRTGSVIALQGWVPAPDEGRLAGVLENYVCAWETEDPNPEDQAEIPIKIKNNRLTAPYQTVTGMYSLPAYNGLDANPFVMPGFALFFGIMFADMAYGIIMAAVGLLFLLKAKPRGGMKNLMGLMVQCGVTTFIFGFLTGGFFGDAIPVIGGIFGKTWTLVPHLGAIHLGSITIDLPLNLLEGNNPLYVLIAALGIGVLHLAVGVGIGCYLKIRDGQWVEAVFCDLCWWVMFAGIAVLVLGGGPVVIYVGIAMLVVGNVLTKKGLGKITGLFGAVYNGLTGYLGDILSYSRLMALMLAGSVIASVFNQLGALGGIFLFIPVFLIGHALNFGLNIIGCFVHTMRLQFLEFFGKWYRDGGRPFRPLEIKTKYVTIKEEN